MKYNKKYTYSFVKLLNKLGDRTVKSRTRVLRNRVVVDAVAKRSVDRDSLEKTRRGDA